MSKTRTLFFAVVTVLSIVGGVSGDELQWDNGSGDSLWRTSENWNPNKLPDVDDALYVDWLGDPTEVIIDAQTEAKCNSITLSNDSVGGQDFVHLHMIGGSLVAGNFIRIGREETAVFTLDDGDVACSAFQLGRKDPSKGIVYINGGTVTVETNVRVPRGGSQGSELHLNGGTLYTNGLVMNDPDDPLSGTNGSMDITGGVMVLTSEEDQTEKIKGYVQNGWLTAYGVKSGELLADGRLALIKIDYDVTNPGMTTVWAVAVDPTQARAPKPDDGAVVQLVDAKAVSFTPAGRAAWHDVYFGTDENAVANADTSDTTGIYRGRRDVEGYIFPEALEWGRVYYWRIDEIETGGTVYAGTVWSFTVADYLLIDDFESYDAGENQIWYSWKDGVGFGSAGDPQFFAGNGTGASVGDETTGSYTEEAIVHGGGQSMPYSYDNNKDGAAKYSEAEHIIDYPRDWTEQGVGVLSLWFRGYPTYVGGFTEDPPGVYTIRASGVDIWDQSDQFHFAYKQTAGAGTIHNPDEVCEAAFSNVSFPDTSVDPQWKDQDVGILANTPEPMYVAVADGAGASAIVYHEDPNATVTDTWTEWAIDTREFSIQGVDLTDIDRIALGFGDRDNPQAGGVGKVYFDDIRLYRPASEPEEIVTVQWLGHSTVKIWTEGYVVYVDPERVPQALHDADLVCVTHTHGDHYSPSDIANVSNAQTQFIGPPDVVQRYGSGQAIAPGQTIDLNGASVIAVPSYNTNKPNHPRSNNWVGYIIELGGRRVYVAGDTDLIEEMKSLGDIDVAFLPAGGTYTMNAVEAAEATQYVRPGLAIPYHWGQSVGTLSDAQRFVELARSPAVVLAVNESISSDNWPEYSPLVAHWQLDEAEGEIARDSAGDNDGTVQGGIWQAAGGKVGGALELDGADDYVSAGPVLNPAEGPFSVFAWVKGGAPAQVVISQTGATGQTWLGADPQSGTLMTGLVPPPAGRVITQPLVSEFAVTDGIWHHVGFAWDGSVRRLFVDGVEVAADAGPVAPPQSSDGGLNIGAGGNPAQGTFWAGLIDDVRAYNLALSIEEIGALAQQ